MNKNIFAKILASFIIIMISLIGIYLGFYHMFVLGIADIINQIKSASPVDGTDIAINILCIVLGIPLGSFSLQVGIISMIYLHKDY